MINSNDLFERAMRGDGEPLTEEECAQLTKEQRHELRWHAPLHVAPNPRAEVPSDKSE